MSTLRTTVPAHRFVPEDRGSDCDCENCGLCSYYHRYRADGSGEFCSHAASHSVHHGSDLPRFAIDEEDW